MPSSAAQLKARLTAVMAQRRPPSPRPGWRSSHWVTWKGLSCVARRPPHWSQKDCRKSLYQAKVSGSLWRADQSRNRSQTWAAVSVAASGSLPPSRAMTWK